MQIENALFHGRVILVGMFMDNIFMYKNIMNADSNWTDCLLVMYFQRKSHGYFMSKSRKQMRCQKR